LKKSRTIEPIKKDSLDREIKLLVTFTLIAFVIVGTLPYLQFHFIDQLTQYTQYAEASQFYLEHDEKVFLRQPGAAATCAITGSNSVVTTAPSGGVRTVIQSSDSADTNGCTTTAFILEDSLFPSYFDSFLSSPFGEIRGIIDIDDADISGSGTTCRYFVLDEPPIDNVIIDPRENATRAYSLMDAAPLTSFGGSFVRCIASNAQRAEGFNMAESFYTDRTNQTFWTWGIAPSAGINALTRGAIDNIIRLDPFLKWTFKFPVNNSNNWWQMQEHAMYGGTFPAITDGFFGIDGTTFTMDSGTTNAQRGQVVLFKQFNKTEFSSLPDLRVQGGIMSLSSSNDIHLHVEVKDGNFQAGHTMGLNTISSTYDKNVAVLGHDDTAYFERDQFMTYMNSTRNTLYSLGVYDLEDPTVGTANNFDISFRPNWSNSTSDIVTVFVAVQDNSTSGSMIANVTSIELENEMKFNFTDINDFVFYEPDCTTGMATTETIDGSSDNDKNCGMDQSNGVTEVNNVTAGTITANELPTPPNVTDLTATFTDSIFLDWDHDLVNVTGFRIYRTSTESQDTESYIDGLPSGSATSVPCADSTPSLAPNSYCSQGGAPMDLAGRMVADMTWNLKKPSGSTTPASATFKGVIFDTVVGGGSDFSTENISVETYSAPTVPSGFTDYTFTFRPPINSTDNSDGVGLFFENSPTP